MDWDRGIVPRRILVTGAAGLVGAEVTGRLADAGLSVVAMIHKSSELKLNNGRSLRSTWGLSAEPTPGRIGLIRGDVSQPSLGMSPDEYGRLASSIDLIVHAAAVTDFGCKPSVYEAVNVVGTANVIDLALNAGPSPTPLLYVSTAYVCGERQGIVREEDLENGQRFGNPYEHSKWEAERLVRNAGAAGLPFVVMRPSIIVGSTLTGQIREFKTIYVVLRVVTTGKVRAVPGNYDATLDMVPIDYVANAIVRAALSVPRVNRRTFHVVSRRATTLRDFSDVLAEYPSLHVPRFVPPSSFDANLLPSLERRYYDRIVKLYESYFRRRIEFSDDGAREMLQGPAPPHGKPFLRRLIAYCERMRYLGAPSWASRACVDDDSREIEGSPRPKQLDEERDASTAKNETSASAVEVAPEREVEVRVEAPRE